MNSLETTVTVEAARVEVMKIELGGKVEVSTSVDAGITLVSVMNSLEI